MNWNCAIDKFFRKAVFLLSLLFFGFHAQAQVSSSTVKGIVVDSSTSQPIANATVTITRANDSSTKSAALTSSTGEFEMKPLSEGSYQLTISYQGLQELQKFFTVSPAQNVLDLGVFKMAVKYKTLKEVVIKDDAAVKMKGDTVAYKADAFKTRPNASVEDLLKKLPGVQVDNKGAVKAQGEQVQKVYVDGKEFFNNDPQMATKNLTADMIDQVQVFNDLGEQSKFSGIDDGSRSKVINLKLKKEKKSGRFGKLYAGFGSEQRYDAGITLNYFKGASQLSFVAATNNLNKMGFAAPGMGITSGSVGRAGITQMYTAGINYRDTWSKELDGNGSYSFKRIQSTNTRKADRRTNLTDSTIISDRQTEFGYGTTDHRFNFRVVYLIDSLNTIIYTPSITFQQSNQVSNDTLTDVITDSATTYKSGESRTVNESTGSDYHIVNNLLWRKRFMRMGRTLTTSFSVNVAQSDRNNLTSIRAVYYNRNKELYNQRSSNLQMLHNQQRLNYAAFVSFTEPLNNHQVLEMHYQYNRNKSVADREVLRYNPLTSHYDEREDSLTNLFENQNVYHQFGTYIMGRKEKYNYQLGLDLQRVNISGNNKTIGYKGQEDYTNLLPSALFNYRFTRNQSLQVRYRSRSNQPTITQLQDIVDLSTYPYIRTGNPALQQEFIHNLQATYNSVSAEKFSSLFVSVYYNQTHQKIVNAVQQRGGEQVIMPVNVDGVFSLGGSVTAGLPLQKNEGGNVNATTRVDLLRSAALVNKELNFISNLSIGEELTLSYTFREKLDIDLMASINYNGVRYSLSEEKPDYFITHNYSCQLGYHFPGEWRLSMLFDYNAYSGIAGSLGENYLLWNTEVVKPVFKNKRGAIIFTVYDILNQNRSITRNIYDNVIENVQSNIQKRFALLTFSYNLTGGK